MPRWTGRGSAGRLNLDLCVNYVRTFNIHAVCTWLKFFHFCLVNRTDCIRLQDRSKKCQKHLKTDVNQEAYYMFRFRMV